MSMYQAIAPPADNSVRMNLPFVVISESQNGTKTSGKQKQVTLNIKYLIDFFSFRYLRLKRKYAGYPIIRYRTNAMTICSCIFTCYLSLHGIRISFYNKLCYLLVKNLRHFRTA